MAQIKLSPEQEQYVWDNCPDAPSLIAGLIALLPSDFPQSKARGRVKGIPQKRKKKDKTPN